MGSKRIRCASGLVCNPSLLFDKDDNKLFRCSHSCTSNSDCFDGLNEVTCNLCGKDGATYKKASYCRFNVIKNCIKNNQCTNEIGGNGIFGGGDNNKSVFYYNVKNQNTGESAPPKNSKRFHTSQRIKDTAFVFGGNQNTKIEKFNINTSIRETITFEMPSLRYHLSSITIDNKIFAIGGQTNNISTNSVDFEIEKMTWIKSGSLCESVSKHDSVILNGVIYVTPGQYFYNIQREGKFTLLKESPIKAFSSAVSLFNENILCCGGYDGNNKLSSCRLYNSVANDWRNIERLPVKLKYGSSVETTDSIIHFGGYDEKYIINEIYIYSRTDKKWSKSNKRLPKSNYGSSKIVV
uniref:Kelch domain-containing protein n=1 Tax=Rhabditophanes sp. KR3021 TaxID=114890 RepID=A0AC35TSJ3_9BILA